jgi:hypothetical protein
MKKLLKVMIPVFFLGMNAQAANQYFAGSNSSTQIYIDSSGNLNFVDPFAGPTTLLSINTATSGVFGGGSLAAFPNTPLGFTGNVNSYLQFVGQNKNAGNAASTDVILTSNNGTDTSYFLDMGINSSGFTTAGSGNPAVIAQSTGSYVYAMNAGLSLGTLDTTINGYVQIFSSATTRLAIANDGTVGINISTTAVVSDPSLFHVSSGTVVFDGTSSSLTETGNATIGGTLTVGGASVATSASTVTYTGSNIFQQAGATTTINEPLGLGSQAGVGTAGYFAESQGPALTPVWSSVVPSSFSIVNASSATAAATTNYAPTNLKATLTPRFAGSKIKVTVSGPFAASGAISAECDLNVSNTGTTNLATNPLAVVTDVAAGVTGVGTANFTWVDTTHGVGATTYTVLMKTQGTTPTCTFCSGSGAGTCSILVEDMGTP